MLIPEPNNVSLNNGRYEVFTPEGWKDFLAVDAKGTQPLVRLQFEAGFIDATDSHEFFTFGKAIAVSDIECGTELDCKSGTVIVLEKQSLPEGAVFDIIEVKHSNHRYYVGDLELVSKNCDEFAFLRSEQLAEDFWASVQPTLSCVAGDTLVLTDHGFVRIDSLHRGRSVGEYFEYTQLNAFGKHGMESVSHGYVSPHSDTLVVTTARGNRVEVTPHHPLYALIEGSIGMTRADSLAVGNAVRVQYGMGIFGNQHALFQTSVRTLEPELAYMVGGMVAEGWITRTLDTRGRPRNMLSVSNVDDEFRNRYLTSKHVVPFNVVPSNPSRLSVTSIELVKLYEEIGFDPTWKCDTKRVPSRILTASQQVQKAFLQGLFDGDGCASGDVVSLSSTSRGLLGDVQLMLANFGIIASVFLAVSAERALAKGHILPQGKIMQTARDAYSLTISGAQRSHFREKVGFGLTRKALTLDDKIINSRGTLNNRSDSVFCVPKSQGLCNRIQLIIEKSTKTHGWFRKKGIRTEKAVICNSGVVTQSFISKLLATIETHNLLIDETDKIFLNELIGPFVWDRIKSITPSINSTYDFTIPATHSFLQNGILGSNTGGSCIVTSTPKSDEDRFAKIWKGAIDNTDEFGNPTYDRVGSNGFFPVRVTWDQHPERDEKWAEGYRQRLGEQRFRQEFCCEFISDDLTLIDPMFLSAMKYIEPQFFVDQVRWFKDPQPNFTYLVALDPAQGTGGDFASVQIFELPGMEQVAEWKHNRTVIKGQIAVVKEMLHYLDEELRSYSSQRGEPQLFWTVENNGLGQAAVEVIENTGEDKFPGTLINEKRRRGQSRIKVRGLHTSKSSKRAACLKLKSLIETGRMIVNSRELLKELKTFVSNASSAAAKPGSHDDLVMAAILCVRMLDTVISYDDQFEELREIISDDDYDSNEPLPVL